MPRRVLLVTEESARAYTDNDLQFAEGKGEEMLGRVTSVHRFLCWGALPLGAALAGVVGDAAGVRAAILVGAAVVLTLGAVAIRPLLTADTDAYALEPTTAA